jgi:regulatory protein
MSTTIVRIEHAGPQMRARRLVFQDGSPSRTTSATAIRELGVEEGSDVSPEQLDMALEAIEPALARDRALLLLGYREHSRAELERKLRDSGYSRELSSRIVKRFVEVELVDDARFAAAWVRSRRLSRYGARRIRQELQRKGIAPEVIDGALDEEAPDETDELLRARAALGSRAASDRAGRDRLVRRLVGRGFSLGVSIAAVNATRPTGSDSVDTPPDLP